MTVETERLRPLEVTVEAVPGQCDGGVAFLPVRRRVPELGDRPPPLRLVEPVSVERRSAGLSLRSQWLKFRPPRLRDASRTVFAPYLKKHPEH